MGGRERSNLKRGMKIQEGGESFPLGKERRKSLGGGGGDLVDYLPGSEKEKGLGGLKQKEKRVTRVAPSGKEKRDILGNSREWKKRERRGKVAAGVRQ